MRKLASALISFLTMIVILATFSGVVSADDKLDGWQFIDGYWYYYYNGKLGTGRWIINDSDYYFDELGRMYTGWLEAMQAKNEAKAKIFYDFLDQSELFSGNVNPADRSLMNCTFTTGSEEEDAAVVAATKANGFDNLKGHRSVGGLRASIYNAMPQEGVEALVEFLKDYEAKK